MTSRNKWSVRLLLDESAAEAMKRFDSWPLHNTVHYMVVGGYDGTDALEDAPFVTLELEADGPDAAESLAHGLLDQACRNAGVGRQRSTVVWVAPLRDEDVRSHRFLEQAKDLFEVENYELAIVAAQVHFELQVRLLMERASGRLGTPWARRLTKNPRVAMLSNDVSTAAAELLLGIDVTQSPLWPAYKVHLNRRNAVVHEGRAMDKTAAQESVNVVQALWAELAKVERPSTLF
jgi:hypothetical protein